MTDARVTRAAHDMPDPDGRRLEPMTKARLSRLREVRDALATVAKRQRDAMLVSAIDTMRRVK